jgi:diaminopimelate decarboxylase
MRADGVRLAEIAREAGTPVHVISADLITARFRAMDHAFAGYPHRLHYALKANSTLAVVRHIRALGASVDANSGGEVEVALRAGYAPADIVFTGVGKTDDELRRAVSLGVRAINVESPGEADRIAAIARTAGATARIAVRINPDIDAESHPHISTGRKANKFGVSIDQAGAMIRDMAARASLEVVGLHVHIGSQLTRVDPIVRATRAIVRLAQDLSGAGVLVRHLDVGGGLGIAYERGQSTVSIDDYARAVLDEVRPTGLELLLEPGRWLVGPAGVLLTRVVDLKPHPEGGRFVIVDAGMTDLIRPALYDAWHEIEPVAPRPGAAVPCDVVGPVCETADRFAARRPLAPLEVGDLVAIRDTGAYAGVMASNYNRRPMAAEVMTASGEWRVIRRRQTIEDMLQWDQ